MTDLESCQLRDRSNLFARSKAGSKFVSLQDISMTMADDHSHCCHLPVENNRDAELDPEFELDFDPTLSSCCERDQVNRRYELRAKQALKRVDRVDLRTRLENSVLGTRLEGRDLQDGSESSLGNSESGLEEGWLS